MRRIASFSINHDILEKGMYISRVDGDVVTYDIRMVKPNCGRYLATDGMHTIEHLFATYVRNSPHSDSVVYVGPMGCRTGFYFLTRDTLGTGEVIQLVRETFRFMRDFRGEIPGATPKECGNAAEHSLSGANAMAAEMCPVLEGWTEEMLTYPE